MKQRVYGEYLINAQGEDVVAGIRTPEPLSKKSVNKEISNKDNSMETLMPNLYKELIGVFKKVRISLFRYARCRVYNSEK